MKLDVSSAITLVLAGVTSVVSGGAWVARTERRLGEHDQLFIEREKQQLERHQTVLDWLERIDAKLPVSKNG